MTVYDIYHCSISTSAQIPDSIVPLVAEVDSVAEVSCYGLHDGYIALSILGSSHISYQWSPGSGDSIRSGLAAGLYSLTATDPAGCADTLSLTLTQPVQVTLAASPADTLICLGQHVLLTATASAAGGVYSWMPGGSGSQDTLVNPAATSAYIITYTTPQCPPLSDTLHVQVAIPPTLSTIDTDLCAGQPVTLTATTSPSGGSYAWSPGGGSTQSITVSPQTSSIYTVTYIIAGCPPVVDSSSVTISPLPAVAVSTHYAVCYDPDGMAIALPSSGTAPYTYQWSDAAHTSTDTLSGLYYGASYTVTVSDLHHCTASASALIPDSIEPLQIMLDSLADVSCYGMSDGYLSLTVTNSTHISYQWSPVSGDSILRGLPAGQYSLTATDPAGCMDTMSFTITQPPAEVLSITPADSLLREGDSLLLLPALTPYPGGSLTYDWSPSIGLSCTDCAQPTFLSTAGQYHYTLVITYHGGMCQISDTVSVRVYSAHLIYVPNAFTPNGDGVNDSYQVFPIGFRYFDLMIFDRWGEKVFESLDQQRGWDGRYLGDLQSPGIYTYILDVTFDDGYTVHNMDIIIKVTQVLSSKVTHPS